MVTHLPEDFRTVVLTPGDHLPETSIRPYGSIKTFYFRYAPRFFQQLAQLPGGIPVTLKAKPWLALWLPLFTMAMLFHVLRLSRSTDLIHAQWSFCGAMAGLAGRLFGLPVITTLRGADIQLAERSLIMRLVFKLSALGSQRLVCVSRAMADRIIKWNSSIGNKVSVIPNGIDIESATLLTKASSHWQIALVGSLIARKGFDVALRAMARLARQSSNAHLIVIGDGPQKRSLTLLAQTLGITEQVHFIGLLEPDRVRHQLMQSDVFILPSHSEGRPNVVLEAMAVGVPVIASDIDGVREIIRHEHSGLLFPDGDDEQLGACLKRLRNDPAMGRRMADNARQWLKDQNLTWTSTSRKYAELYRQVLEDYQEGRAPCAE
jgi:glycosyltransferase involved in cell wall biosynthesis